MLPSWVWIVANVFACVIALPNNEDHVSIELTELNYEDNCSATAAAEWAYLDSSSNETAFEAWKNHLTEYGDFKKGQRDETANVSETSLKDSTFRYKLHNIEQAGDALLEKEDWKRLVNFTTWSQVSRTSAVYVNQTKKYLRSDVERLLSHSGNAQEKYTVWHSWHRKLSALVITYSDILHLVKKAATKNGVKDAKEYWELLSQYPGGYEEMKQQWNTLTSLHKRILQFARLHLSRKYGIHITEAIPAHLLGSLQGCQWNSLSIDVSPYAQITYDVKKGLWKEEILGKSLYKIASKMGSQIFAQVPQLDFWSKSRFDRYCPPKLINFCNGSTRVFTCFEPTVENFLQAHKNVGKVLFNQISLISTPVLNVANRYSVLEEGVAELFGILSASPAWLSQAHLMIRANETEEQQIVSLMITALDVLPRLAYYMSADMWRINALEKGIEEPAELVESWWKHRQKYEGITSEVTDLPTFLNDEYITNNKPYLAKFIGVLLGFQLYNYVMESTEVRYDQIGEKENYANIVKLIQQGAGGNFKEVLDRYLDINEITESPLLSFFAPLNEFMEELEEDSNYNSVSMLEAELEYIEQNIIHKIDSSNTTKNTVITTTTTTATTTAPAVITITSTITASNTLKPKSTKESESDASMQADKPENRESSLSAFDKPPNFGDYDEQDNKKPKINTSKAVWAVTAVLVATITVCVIVIFGRYRCRKTPKNRRYV